MTAGAAMEHTEACVEARRETPPPRDDWPMLSGVRRWGGDEAVAAILECPHWSHDTQRWWVEHVGQP